MQRHVTIARMVCFGILSAVIGSAVAQPQYPTKPIRLVIPYPPGGGTTPIVRIVAQQLEEAWGQSIVVDNRGGGNTLIGTDIVAKAPSDGYTLLVVTSTHAINHTLMSTPYNAIVDFTPVATFVAAEFVLVVNPSLPVRNLQELIALAKEKPGRLNYSSSGIGTSNHLVTELFSAAAGVKMQHVSYRGGGPAVADLLGGQVDLSFQAAASVLSFIQSGRLRPIAVSGPSRLAILPQVPTLAEAGLPGIDATIWYGILAPAGTPKYIVNKVSDEIGRIVAIPDVSEKLAAQGVTPYVSTPEQFAALLKTDMAKYAKIIKAAQVKVE